MCRKNHLQGCCLSAFGLGLLIGNCMESGFWCFWGGVGLILFGLCVLRKRPF